MAAMPQAAMDSQERMESDRPQVAEEGEAQDVFD
jgi:hypothetical protein